MSGIVFFYYFLKNYYCCNSLSSCTVYSNLTLFCICYMWVTWVLTDLSFDLSLKSGYVGPHEQISVVSLYRGSVKFPRCTSLLYVLETTAVSHCMYKFLFCFHFSSNFLVAYNLRRFYSQYPTLVPHSYYVKCSFHLWENPLS